MIIKKLLSFILSLALVFVAASTVSMMFSGFKISYAVFFGLLALQFSLIPISVSFTASLATTSVFKVASAGTASAALAYLYSIYFSTNYFFQGAFVFAGNAKKPGEGEFNFWTFYWSSFFEACVTGFILSMLYWFIMRALVKMKEK
jgi:hypothetical protein